MGELIIQGGDMGIFSKRTATHWCVSLALVAMAQPASAAIERIFDSGRASRVCLPGPGCSPSTLLPATRGVDNIFIIEGPWVDWARVTVRTVSGSGSMTATILEQSSPSLGQGRLRLRLTPVSSSTGIREITLRKRTNELNPAVPASMGTFRIQMVRNGRPTGISNSRITAGATNVQHIISGSDLGNAELIAPSNATVRIVSSNETSYEVRSTYAGGRTTDGRAVYRLRERIGPFNGFWYNEYYPAQIVTVLADQTAPPPPAPTSAPNPLTPSGTYNTALCADPPPPQFSWTRVSGATNYEIFYRNLTSGRTHLERTGSSTSKHPPFRFLDGNEYQWRVRAANASGNGPWSAFRGFTGADGGSTRCTVTALDRRGYF